MNKLNSLLNIIMGAFIGVFIGRAIFIILDYKTHPELYAMQSAPWYTSILQYAIFTVILLLICLVIKALSKRKVKKTVKK